MKLQLRRGDTEEDKLSRKTKWADKHGCFNNSAKGQIFTSS